MHKHDMKSGMAIQTDASMQIFWLHTHAIAGTDTSEADLRILASVIRSEHKIVIDDGVQEISISCLPASCTMRHGRAKLLDKALHSHHPTNSMGSSPK